MSEKWRKQGPNYPTNCKGNQTKCRESVPTLLDSEEIFISTDNDCSKVTAESVETEHVLVSNQEEADTKVVLHYIHALSREQVRNIIVRSPSGDIDIIVIMIGLLLEEQTRCFLDTGSGNNRKGLWLSDVDMSKDLKQALIGFHSFTGNDYTSSFFRKVKVACWKVVETNHRFLHAFKELGSALELAASTYEILEEYVCLLFGSRKRKVNDVRYDIFHRKYSNKNKIVDLSLLPPCQSTLKLHSNPANFVAKIWKSAGDPHLP